MRNCATALVIVGLAMAVGLGAQAAAPHVFSLTFDDGGNPGQDSSGNGNDATLNGGATWVAGGQSGGAIQFDGVDGYVEVEMDVPEFNFTMGLWIQTEDPAAGVYSVLDGIAGAGGHDRHFYLDGGNICFRVWQGAGWCTDAGVADGSWHHIALVAMDGEGQHAYVDGVDIGVFDYDHSDFDWQKRVWIGFSNDGANNYFTGLIDGVTYTDAALSQDDVVGELMSTAVEAQGKLTTTWGGVKTDYR